MKTGKWIFLSALLTVGMMPLLWLQQGCTGSHPPITVFVPPPFTPTPTPTPAIVTFDGVSSLPASWISVVASGAVSVPSLALSTAQNQESSCPSLCNSLWAGPISFFAANQAANIEYDYTSAGIDLTGLTISLYYFLDALPSNASYGQIYIQDTSFNYQSTPIGMAAGIWTLASIPSNHGGVNPAKILKYGVQIGTGNTGSSFSQVNFYVDYVTIK